MYTVDDENELRARVALMRELGVARWGEIVLSPSPLSLAPRAPAPVVAETDDARAVRLEGEAREDKRRRYARELGISADKMTDKLLEQFP